MRSKLLNSAISTYNYKPLVGIQKISDPQGISTYFKYESFGRLAEIRDNDEYLRSHYVYQFANQQPSEYLPANQTLNMTLDMVSGVNPAFWSTNGTFKATITGGSGQYKYLWYVDGILKVESSSNQFTVKYSNTVSHTITCKTVDLITQDIAEKSIVVSIQFAHVTIENFVCDHNNAMYRADVKCDIETDITFELVYTKNGNKSDQAEFNIGEFIILKSSQEITKTVKFKKGITPIYINLVGDNESNAHVEFMNATNSSFNSYTVFSKYECF